MEQHISTDKRAILFDLYGTLIYEEPGLDEGDGQTIFALLAEEAGVPLAAYRAARNASSHFAMTGQLENAARVADTLQRLDLFKGDERGLRAKAATLHDLEMQLRHSYSKLYPTTLETLAEARRRGYKTALVSNSTSYAEISLVALGLEEMFDHVSLSHKVGAVKPDPRIFLETTEALGVTPYECFFVGDGGGSEITASTALGMTAILIRQKYSHSLNRVVTGQSFTIESLSELLNIIEEVV